jgi:hypothetical protein
MQSRIDLYSKITNKIIADLEQGVRTWFKPWSAEHTAGRITRPLRSNFEPYNGVNVLVLWSEAVTRGYSCPVWITYKQSEEFGGQVRKGERGSMVVYADRFRKSQSLIKIAAAGALRSEKEGFGDQHGDPPQIPQHRRSASSTPRSYRVTAQRRGATRRRNAPSMVSGVEGARGCATENRLDLQLDRCRFFGQTDEARHRCSRSQVFPRAIPGSWGEL